MIETLLDYPALQAIQRALWHVSDVRGAAVMVGSGFSMNAELASPSSKGPPLWSQMATAMDQQLGSGSSGVHNPLRLAEEFRALLGQAALDGLIRDLVPDAEWLPGGAHRRLLDLPWSDVLSTNWDTLLERARADLPERSYDVVLTPQDIARTRSPRIIKLHGSLPSHTPFIFAEEDYRTYPTKFAPFVNLAQHILLENELLLLGFSGDDPNFLAWAGWVRDQLGTSARRIRLAGVLNLTPARRRYLENLNVTPIDLAPLVGDIADPKNRHARATTLLLDSLHKAKPKPIHVWTRSNHISIDDWNLKSPQSRVVDLVKDWEADRADAPAWLVAPFIERSRLRMDTADVALRAVRDLDKLDPSLRGRFVAELAWRLEIGHFGVPEWAKEPLESALNEDASALAAGERVRVLVLLCYHAIDDCDFPSFERLVSELDAAREQEPEAGPWAAYLRGLFARNRLDLAGIAAAIPQIVGNDPVWLLRSAALQCAIGDSSAAALLVREAMLDIRRRRTLDRRSLWLLSRESWARFLWRSLSFELRNEKEDGIEVSDDWPIAYDEHRTDPWDELNALDSELRQHQEHERKYSGEEKAHFEAGSWTPKSDRPTNWVADWAVPAEWLIRRLADTVGLPARGSRVDIIETRLARSVGARNENADIAAVWRVASYLNSEDGELMNTWFGRVQVGAMPLTLVEHLITSLRGSIEFLVSKLRHHDQGYTNRVDYMRTLTELLSRLAVRTAPSAAGELVELAISVFERGGGDHWWLWKATSHLIKRSLSAIPPSERGAHAGKMLAFPLPSEGKAQGIERDWPEFSDLFRSRDVTIERPVGEWDRRVAELIDRIENNRDDNRHRAILRLWLLYQKTILTEAEKLRLANAVWAQRPSPYSLPADDSFYPGIFVQLPEPTVGMAAAAFDHDIVQPLLTGKVNPGSLESLAYVGSEADKGRAERPFSADVALALIRSIPRPSGKHMDDETASAIFFGLLPVAVLDNPMAAELWDRTTTTSAMGAILFLPYLARYDPSRAEQAAARIVRAINSREFNIVNYGLTALRQWARMVDKSIFPRSLAVAAASLVAIRRDPGLFRAIDVCVDLVERDLLSREGVQNVLDGLSELLAETDYQSWRRGDFRTATLTYVRANAYRLAQALHRKGQSDPAIEGWIAAGSTDPVPEVRYVTDQDD